MRPRSLALLVFFQMLPATLVAPAIRPLFATYHGGQEGPMHAFMSLNMLGAILAAPFIGLWVDRRGGAAALVLVLCLLDGVLLAACTADLPVAWVLGLRTLEGAAHVGAATILMAHAAKLSRATGSGKVMGLAGGALMLAVACGSAFGGATVGIDPRLPFWLGSAVCLVVGVVAHRQLAAAYTRGELAKARPSDDAARTGMLALLREHAALAVPVSAAFVGRFTVGCLIVTFALFAHRAHGLGDGAIGGLFTLLTFPFALAMYPAARIGDVIPRTVVLGGGALLYAGGLLAIPLVPTAGLPVLMVVLGAASAGIFAPTLCYAATLAGEASRGRAMSLVNAAGCLGMVLGPAAAGITSAVVGTPEDPIAGYQAAFVLASGSVVLWLVASAPWLLGRLRVEQAGRVATRS